MYPAPVYYPPPAQGQGYYQQNAYAPAYPQAYPGYPQTPSPTAPTLSPGQRPSPDRYPYKSPPLDNPQNKSYYTSGNVPADPTCSKFPGLVPNSDKLNYSGFDNITLSLFAIKGATEIPSQWLSTGFYAVPGLQIRVAVTTNIQDPNQRQNFFQDSLLLIGCHTDDNRSSPEDVDQNNLLRPPVISIQTEINAYGVATLANPYGGLIYLIIPSLGLKSYQINIALSGGRVRAPIFKLGQTKLNDWINRIRHAPGPYGELQTDKIIICLPRSELKKVKNPAPILRFWDGVLDAMYDLLGKPRERARPERLITDIQIAYGWMHANYPIMTFLEKIPDILDWQKVRREGDWGCFHELGHNHEEDVWVFDGTGEVCVNIFAMYIYDVHLKIPLSKSEHGDTFLPKGMKEQAQTYIKSNKNFEKVWKAEAFLALLMYYQLLLRYSWQAFTAVFTAYRSLSPQMLPVDDEDDDKRKNQEKIHLWIYMFSQTVKEDLYEFFKSWNLPIKDMRCGEFTLKINPNFPQCPMRMEDLLRTGPVQHLQVTAKTPYFYENNAEFIGVGGWRGRRSGSGNSKGCCNFL